MLQLIILLIIGFNFLAGLVHLRKYGNTYSGTTYMALIKWGALVTDGRGKIGGTVLTKGRSGAVMRNKVTPVNPKSAKQTEARNRLITYSQAWRDLTEAQREAWNAAVVDFQGTNIFGDTVSPTGKNLFTKLNVNLDLVGVSQISDPPEAQTVPAMTSISLAMAEGAGTASLTFDPTPVPANTAFLVRMSAGKSAGRSFVSSELKLVDVLDAADTSPADVATAYTNVFGSVPAAGQKVFVEVVGINKVTGQRGTALRASAIVAA